MKNLLKLYLKEHQSLFKQILTIESSINKALELLKKSVSAGNKIMICGNGGSAADAQHFAAEIIGRFEKERVALPAVALTTDTSAITAIGNDYGYDVIFSRQVEGLGNEGDVLVGISTSGNSNNVIKAVESARKKGIATIGLLGKDGGKLTNAVDIAIIVPHDVTARIQEAHIFIVHYWSALIENITIDDQ